MKKLISLLILSVCVLVFAAGPPPTVSISGSNIWKTNSATGASTTTSTTVGIGTTVPLERFDVRGNSRATNHIDASNVRFWGAVGDGVTDNLAAFNAAVANAQDGGTIFVPEGDFGLSDTWYITKGISIKGIGLGSSIKPLAGFPANHDFIVISNRSNLSVTGIQTDMQRRGGNWLTLFGEIHQILVDGNMVQGVASNHWGIELRDTNSPIQGFCCSQINRNEFYDFDGGGIWGNKGGDTVSITKNTFQLVNSSSHIILWDSVNSSCCLSIADNNATGSGKFIEVNNATEFKIIRNQFEATVPVTNGPSTMIVVNGNGSTVGGTIANNNINCHLNCNTAILLYNIQDSSVVNNTITQPNLYYLNVDPPSARIHVEKGPTEGTLLDTGGGVEILIDDAGKIGIGTGVPGAALDVMGDARIGTNAGTWWHINAPGQPGRISLGSSGSFDNGIINAKGTGGFIGINYDSGTAGLVVYNGSATANAKLAGLGSQNSYIGVLGGMLGIGTNAPTSTLDVIGDAEIRGVARVGSTNGTWWEIGSPVGRISIGSTGPFDNGIINAKGTGGAIGINYDSGTAGLIVYNGSGSPNAKLAGLGSANSYIGALGGNLGIGMVSPDAKLDVTGDFHLSAEQTNTALAGTGSRLVEVDNLGHFSARLNTNTIGTGGGPFILEYNGGGTNTMLFENVRVVSTNESTGATLHIAGTNNAGNVASLEFKDALSNTTFTIAQQATALVPALNFQYGSTTIAQVAADGSVGVGLTNPGVALDIAGDLRATNIAAQGTITATNGFIIKSNTFPITSWAQLAPDGCITWKSNGVPYLICTNSLAGTASTNLWGGGGGGSQTPWTADEDAAGFSLSGVGNIIATNKVSVGATTLNHTNQFTVSTPYMTNAFGIQTNGDMYVHGYSYFEEQLQGPIDSAWKWRISKDGSIQLGGGTVAIGGPFATVYAQGEITFQNLSGSGSRFVVADDSGILRATIPTNAIPIANISTPGFIPTNGGTVSFTYSNNFAVDKTHSFIASNATASSLASFDAANQLTNAGISSDFAFTANKLLLSSTATNIANIATPGLIVTNGESQAITVSNTWAVDKTHSFIASNATASSLASFDAANQLTNAGIGPNFAFTGNTLVLSSTATNIANIATPGNILTNGESLTTTVSNTFAVDKTHGFIASNATASAIASFDGKNYLTNAMLDSSLALTANSLGLAIFPRMWAANSGNALLGANATYYFAPNGNGQTNLQTADVSGFTRNLVTRTTVLQNFYGMLTVAPGASRTTTFTVMTNGVASSITFGISASAVTGNDTVHTETIVAGVEVGIRIATVASAAAAKPSWALEGK